MNISTNAGYKTTKVFSANLQALLDGYDLIVNSGGQGSSKTTSIVQLLLDVFFYHKNKIITIASYALPHLRAGVMRDLENQLILAGLNVDDFKKYGTEYHSPTGSVIECIGIQGNEARATGPRRDYLYINEPHRKITYEVFELMNARTHVCTFMDFNPSHRFWYHDKIKPNFKHKFIHSTYLDNPYMPEREKRNLLSKKDKPGFENWWKVYGLGELGNLEGAILINWSYGSEDEFQEAEKDKKHLFGLDFGYDPDPDAMSKNIYNHNQKKIFAKELIYQTNNGTIELIHLISNKVKKNELIIADSSSPRIINDIRKAGFNIRGVIKTKTVSDWLRLMQDYEIIISEDSVNLADELDFYIWNDKKAGIPIDAFNHLIDEIRYGFMETYISTPARFKSRGVI